MTDDPIDELGRRNPVRPDDIEATLSDADRARLLAVARASDPEATTTPRDASRWRRRRLFGLAAAGLAIAFTLIVILGGSGTGPVEEPAFAQAAIAVAEGNPRLLVEADGWSVDNAGEFEVDQGNIDFVNGDESLRIDWGDARYYSEPEAPKQGFGVWSRPKETSCSVEADEGESIPKDERSGMIVTEEGERIPLRLADCDTRYRVSEVSFLGQRVLVAENQQLIDGEEPVSSFDLQLPPSKGIFVSINASGMSADRFYDVLGSVQPTDVDTWLAALPDDIVRPVDRPEIVAGMLEGLPVPPEVDTDALEQEAGALDRYQLGAKVSGGVACAWLDRWAEGVRTGDDAVMAEATEAMSSSRDWPILKEMAKEGGYAQVVWEYARDMENDDREALLGSAGTETIDDKTYEVGPSYATGLGCDSEKRTLREE
ncbi:MAG: hypothetical protein U0R51_10640 [Solirubrobacterales bacterium]